MTEKPPKPPKPLPTITALNRPFWDGARRGELTMQKCSDCGHVRYPVSEFCPKCLSEKAGWEKLSGRGEVYSALVFHQVYNQAFRDDVPYQVSLIQLEEGPRMFSNVVGVPPEDVHVGDKVKVIFEKVNDDVTLPKFEKA